MGVLRVPGVPRLRRRFEVGLRSDWIDSAVAIPSDLAGLVADGLADGLGVPDSIPTPAVPLTSLP